MLSGVGIGAMAMAMLAGPALAQSAAPPAVDEIVVTGVRASVSSAQQLRKNASQLVDSIVAEDIGKLPDNNVVEALQHVSGVSIVRNSVEPGTVLIRGLPDIATTARRCRATQCRECAGLRTAGSSGRSSRSRPGRWCCSR